MANITLTVTAQQVTRAETALRDYYPFDSEGQDSRTPQQLIQLFLKQHLGQLVRSYEAGKASREIPDF